MLYIFATLQVVMTVAVIIIMSLKAESLNKIKPRVMGIFEALGYA